MKLCGVVSRDICGEAGDVNQDTVANWTAMLPSLNYNNDNFTPKISELYLCEFCIKCLYTLWTCYMY
jgi:hypothetical protein